MKISKAPTPLLLVAAAPLAGTTSLEFILLQLSPDNTTRLQEQLRARNTVWNTKGFQYLSVAASPEGWYQENGHGIQYHLEHQMLSWAFVELEPGGNEELKPVASNVTNETLLLQRHTAVWTATCNGQTIQTQPFPLDYILSLVAFG